VTGDKWILVQNEKNGSESGERIEVVPKINFTDKYIPTQK
jgi:hypothetical protein